MSVLKQLTDDWRSRLKIECSEYSQEVHQSIIDWLIGENPDRLLDLNPEDWEIAVAAMDYRYRILRDRYLGVAPEVAYRKLMKRLASLFLIRNKIRTWVALSRDRQRSVVDVLQEVIQELLQSDRYLKQQMGLIQQITPQRWLQNTLILATLEEYCLRPIRNQPLLLYRFLNYLRRSQRGGMTNIPTGNLVRLISEELSSEESDDPISLLDRQAIVEYQDTQTDLQQQRYQRAVAKEFQAYLHQALGEKAANWLKFYLQGRTQEEIAPLLDLSVKQVYRLREKVSYHAIRIFAIKQNPELVSHWLDISLQDHSLGLTPSQWQTYLDSLTPTQKQLLELLRARTLPHEIAEILNWKTSQVIAEWSKLYLAAQSLRNL
ncbi:MAG: HetZ-related protein 2 [Roseofilum sp. SBFL]|uniref:HetZ-related protein 2 n=1 Tax=unclassified Roseofilum TaxID=2620099 RepID=UPI001B141ED5|nr:MULTISPECIES: HetZ-related protein 2 [unclassified Roseofilum]MBP0013524.1 HetZ-related protein 2 [Roseofilum sp. SID3]MBP0026174.1 HetZ-related protein 2 [Roseofilum sp. SID2]MBP0036440.1 HetZ-related protein 2 [Roseofilum sp. SID1]MBP0044572.1 HetZ-related protein 2 [Roseofilum sp. SBFL]